MARRNGKISVDSIQVGFKSNMDLVVYKDVSKNMIGWGKKNAYPAYLLSLYKGQPQHQGIVSGKAKYISGNDIEASTPIGQQWIENANSKENWHDLLKKLNKDYTLYGGRALRVIPNALGTPLAYFHLDFGRCRMSLCETMVHYCEDWTQTNQYGISTYPIWYPGCNEVAVYIQKRYNQAATKIEAAYPELEYEGAIKDIDTLKRIQNSRNSLVINDFSAGTVCVIKGGRPETKEEVVAQTAKIQRTYSGDENTARMPVIYTDPVAEAGVEFSTVPTNGLDKKYIEVTTAATRNVYAAHNVPPELFNYIADSVPLFDKQKLADQNELFMNTYVLPEQGLVLDMLDELFSLRYPGQICDFEINQFKPVGVNASDPNIAKYMTADEIRESLGLPKVDKAASDAAHKVIDAINSLSPLVANKVLESMSSEEIRSLVGLAAPPALGGRTVQPGTSQQPVQQAQVNDHLKNLTGKQTQGIMRIVRKFKNGEYSEAQAKLLLQSGFGLSDAECNQFLDLAPQQVPIQQRMAFAQRQKWTETLRAKKVKLPEDHHVIETKFFQSPFSGSIRDLVGNLLGGSKKAAGNGGADDAQYEYYTVFTYGLREGVEGPVILPTTRQWCKDTYEEFKNIGDALPLEAIEEMVNDFDMNAYDYAGGFWNDNGEIKPYCRHGWMAHTVRRKI